MNPIESNERIEVLDFLRGFALIGILLVNILPLLSVKTPALHSSDAAYQQFLYLFVEGRFYTIFSFLFGVGFYIFISRANEKGLNAMVLFLRRMIVLLIFGLFHVRFHSGEALSIYAFCGLILIPFYKAPRAFNFVFGLLMLIVLSVFSIKILLPVPLMLLGISAGQYRVFEGILKQTKTIALWTGCMVVIGAIGLYYQYQYVPSIPFALFASNHFLQIGITIGPVITAFYVGLLIILLRCPFFHIILSPLKSYGRMALTNYVSQTALVLLAGYWFNLYDRITYFQSFYVCVSIYVFQLFFSVIWLRFFRFGPLEWVWRMATYMEVLPLKRYSPRKS
jgi:uncharacterized membrane protein YeiB